MAALLTKAFHRPTQKIISIDAAKRGLQCECICPKCDEPLIAKKGQEKTPHFAHKSDSICIGAEETALHKLAKEIIETSTYIILPDNTKFEYSETRIEKRIGNIVPDILLVSSSESIIVEIHVTHTVDKLKGERINSLGIKAVEIDLSNLDRSIDESILKNVLIDEIYLKDFILTTTENRQKSSFFSNDLLEPIAIGLFLLLFVLGLLIPGISRKNNRRRKF